MKKQTQKRSLIILTSLLAYSVLVSSLFSSCGTVRAPDTTGEISNEITSSEFSKEKTVESGCVPENEDHEASLMIEEIEETVRVEDHSKSASSADDTIETSENQARPHKEPAVNSVADRNPEKNKTVKSPILTPTSTQAPTPCPKSKATPSPEPEVNEEKCTATPSPAPNPTVCPTSTPKPVPTTKPTSKPAVAPTVEPMPSATPVPTVKPTVKPTPTPAPQTERVWVVDVPGHYEIITESKEVWIEEQGHWEENGYWKSDWVYRCNQCGAQYPTLQEVNQHLDDSFDWDSMTGHSSYTQVSGPQYWVESNPVWVVDVPGHYETVTESKSVWVEEQGHWETITK